MRNFVFSSFNSVCAPIVNYKFCNLIPTHNPGKKMGRRQSINSKEVKILAVHYFQGNQRMKALEGI